MILIGRAVKALSILYLATAVSAGWAAVTASLDRQSAALGDTLRLTITATDGEDLDQLDLKPLTADFEILQRSRSSKTSYVNGEFSSTKEVLLEISPRREGSLAVPPLKVGQQVTSGLPVIVGPAPTSSNGDQDLLFEAELDSSSVYVQGQVILTLRLQQAINLDDRSITELQLDNAFVLPLEQNSFQRSIDGRPWLVHEVRYAIFPEQSGTLEIPAQTFSARQSTPRRSLFDSRGNGRQLRRTTQPLTIDVLPRPANYPAGEWLPARELTLNESWSTPPEELKVGESATRTVTLRGEGLQGAQLPPVLYPQTQGLKFYPDQPAISDNETPTGLVGIRIDSVAVVPTQAGSWELPELRIPWWDTHSNQLRYAILPGRTLDIAPGSAMTSALPKPAPSAAPALTAESAAPIPLVSTDNSRLWQIIAAVSGSGWLLTLIYLFWTRNTKRKPSTAPPLDNAQEGPAFKSLLQACKRGEPMQARATVIDWAGKLSSQPGLASLAQVSAIFEDAEMKAALDALNSTLYSNEQPDWDGTPLAEAAERLRSLHRKAPGSEPGQLQLYPTT